MSRVRGNPSSRASDRLLCENRGSKISHVRTGSWVARLATSDLSKTAIKTRTCTRWNRYLVDTRFDTFRTSHSRASAYGSLHESPSSVSTVLVPHRSVPSRQAHGWPLWCDIVRGGRPLCSYAVARRWHPIQGPMAHALSTVFDSSGPSLKHGGRCAHHTRGYHHQLHDRSTSSSLCSG